MKVDIIIGISIIVILIIIYKYYKKIIKEQRYNPIYIREPTNAKKAKIKYGTNVPLPSSGTGYSISIWIFIDEWEYKKGVWKHILHKGSDTGDNSQPGIWLHPIQNKLFVFYNTENLGYKCKKIKKDSPDNKNDSDDVNTSNTNLNPKQNINILKEKNSYSVVDNVPLRRWFHLGIVIKDTACLIYIDGLLKISKPIYSQIKQNNGSLYVTRQGGFSGLISQLRYYSQELTHDKIQKIYSSGPKPWNYPDLFKFFALGANNKLINEKDEEQDKSNINTENTENKNRNRNRNTQQNSQKPELNFDNKVTEKPSSILENTESSDRSSLESGTSSSPTFVPSWFMESYEKLKARSIDTSFLKELSTGKYMSLKPCNRRKNMLKCNHGGKGPDGESCKWDIRDKECKIFNELSPSTSSTADSLRVNETTSRTTTSSPITSRTTTSSPNTSGRLADGIHRDGV